MRAFGFRSARARGYLRALGARCAGVCGQDVRAPKTRSENASIAQEPFSGSAGALRQSGPQAFERLQGRGAYLGIGVFLKREQTLNGLGATQRAQGEGCAAAQLHISAA